MHTTTGTAINWKNDGEQVALSGSARKIGAFIGVLATDIHPGETGAVNIAGVYRLPKSPGETWEPGARLSYDADTGLFSAGSGGGIGCVAAGYAAADEESGLVLLNAGAGSSGGGGGGTDDYAELSNKPKINGRTLSGDQDNEALGIPTKLSDLVDDEEAITAAEIAALWG